MRSPYQSSLVRLSALAFAAACCTPAVAQPDISGVWQAYASVSAPGAGQSGALTEAGADRVDAFFDRYGDDMPELDEALD